MPVPILGQDGPPTKPKMLLRVLYCMVCKTLDELPNYDGSPDDDVLLNIVVERHRFPSGDPHLGHLFVMPVELWTGETRLRIIEQIKGGGSKGLAEFDASFYDSRSQFGEDALTCYQAHNRPKAGCADYMSSSKVLLPQTKADRKDLGMSSPKSTPGPKVSLCQFCPVHSTVTNRKRTLMGL